MLKEARVHTTNLHRKLLRNKLLNMSKFEQIAVAEKFVLRKLKMDRWGLNFSQIKKDRIQQW